MLWNVAGTTDSVSESLDATEVSLAVMAVTGGTLLHTNPQTKSIAFGRLS